jgi:tRNA nucleotidyltransferase (CCA-adding enzyme)
MEAGEYHIHPDDSLESLQHLMIETGWGQIPVIDREDGKIQGIVTRTDLLKTLTEKSGIPGRSNLANKLDKSLPLERLILLKAIASIAYENNSALYIVGGFVRDLLLDQPSIDFDLVVEGDAILLARKLVHRYGGRLTSHTRFGTSKWLLDPKTKDQLTKNLNSIVDDLSGTSVFLETVKFPDSVDLVTARTEFYTHPTALPTIERSSIKFDLHRRDFTINTLALRLDGTHYGELYDYWGGLSDLRHGIVKVLHSLSFVDDPTRILRAIRFEQRFKFKIEKRTFDLMIEAANLLERVSGDRIRHELDSIITEIEHIRMFERLAQLNLLRAIHPDLIWDEWLKEKVIAFHRKIPELEWGIDDSPSTRIDLTYIFLLLRQSDVATLGIQSRLKLSAWQVKMIQAARSLMAELPSLSSQLPSQIVSRIEALPLKSIFAVYFATDKPFEKVILEKYIVEWRKIKPRITGSKLRARGIPPGPHYRIILGSLKSAWLDGAINTQKEEEIVLERLLHEAGIASYK